MQFSSKNFERKQLCTTDNIIALNLPLDWQFSRLFWFEIEYGQPILFESRLEKNSYKFLSIFFSNVQGMSDRRSFDRQSSIAIFFLRSRSISAIAIRQKIAGRSRSRNSMIAIEKRDRVLFWAFFSAINLLQVKYSKHARA